MRVPLLLLALIFAVMPAGADDGAASIAAGGLIVMKREPRIVMAKEVLTISPRRVLVDYDFRNDSDADVTTEIAFPIPAYTLGQDERPVKQYGFDDFRLWVGGQTLKFAVETRAFVGKRDISGVLASMRVDAASFGHYQDSVTMQGPMDGVSQDVKRLSAAQRARLIALKAISDDDSHAAQWKVEKKYHWTQTFPAHAVVHIRHQYKPVLGNSNTIGDVSHFNPKREEDAEMASVCPSKELLGTLTREHKYGDDAVDDFSLSYVDFILTTANTWKTPIEDFTLIVERPHDSNYNRAYVSFCWNGQVNKIDADHFSAHVDGLVPSKELRVGYIFGNGVSK